MDRQTPEVTYSVQTIRSGQPRAYADTEHEYLITMKWNRFGQEGLVPYLFGGNVEARISEETALRKAGRMSGGYTPEQLRAQQRDWAKTIVRTLCRNFREKGDDDGLTGISADLATTLKWMKLDPIAGTIHAFIISPYCD